MKSQYTIVLALLLLVALLIGCSKENPEAVFGGHPADWVCNHSVDALQDPGRCTSCHGADFNGSGNVPGCFDCHLGSFPTFSIHPDGWNVVITDHQNFAFSDSWTTCAVADCHGADLQGGSNPFCATGPSCFTVVGCHTTPDNSPPAPHGTPYVAPTDHGPDAKNFFNDGQGQLYCRNCHGLPQNNFDGGFVTTAILGHPVANGSCSVCHPAAKAHPTEWQGTNDPDPTYFSTHRTIDPNSGIVESSCALCHKTSSAGAGPMPGAPSCYSVGFNNISCHPNGPGNAPHATDGTYQDPVNHGPDAKTNLGLDFCKDCHARLVAGNYKFDVQIGQLLSGCETCHIADAAHPPAPLVLASQDRWTFRGDPAVAPRRTHFAATAPQTNCTLCHGANLDGVGGTGPSCLTCHTDTVQFNLNCTACHGTPPNGASDETVPTPVNHTTVSDQAGFNSAHDECTACHGAKDDGTGSLSVVGVDYELFDRNTPALSQGGDHLDGNIEMNGPAPATGAGYNETSFNCFNACHSELPPYVLSDSGLLVEYGNYGNSPGGCTFCHGYPPDGTPDATGAPTPVNHTGVTNLAGFLSAHNDCSACHGVKDDGTGTHLPTGNYDVAADHRDGNINLNLDTQYDQATFGCNAACHLNAPPYQLSDSGLPVVLDSYGSGGGGGACDSCHTTGVGGAPIVIAGTTSHTVSWTCEECHTAHGSGTVIIPNNAAVGINYPAADHLSGISLGGAATTGTTEAQICWNCHDTYNISEWGVNNNAVTGNSSYNYGTLTGGASNWVGAEWNSGTAKFAYKTGTISSTHAANPASGVSGVDLVANIRCSYCHDVHDLNLLASDNTSGAPYLRGTWMGNPYPEDGAPQTGDSWTPNGRFGAVPRGGTQANEQGGYQIDQNNSNPTSGWTADGSSSLCELCHGTGDGTWDIGTTDGNGDNEIDRINMFGNASTDWVGTNGHSNAVIGGTGNRAADIFSMSDRNPSGAPIYTSNGSARGNPRMAYGNAGPADQGIDVSGTGTTRYRGYGLRGEDGSAYRMAPLLTNSEPYAFRSMNWGAAIDNTIDTQYHKFSCSKCHNPHASRLPRLMITNCLDTSHNTWDNNKTTPTSTTLAVENRGVPLSNATSAQNCHRRRDSNYGSSTGSGWNNVTPW